MFNFDRENTSLIAKWWRNTDKEILFLFIFLFLLGLFFSFSSTSSVVAEKMNLSVLTRKFLGLLARNRRLFSDTDIYHR